MPTINGSSKKTFAEVFNKTIFSVPKYQRAYSWEEDNWRELWDDIYENVSIKDKEHFLGAIIYYHGPKSSSNFSNYEIIDGQQRLTTLTILMRVLYEQLHSSTTEVYPRFAEELYQKYLGGKNGDFFFLNLSKKDEIYFRDYIQKITPNRKAGRLISNKKIRKCYEFFNKKVSECSINTDSREEFCWQLKKKIEENLIFVVIDVTTDVDAYTIFESINSKRRGLTVSDLLKNYIFSAADQYQQAHQDSKKLPITEDMWERMEQELGRVEINQYVRHFWISNYKKVFEKNLYSEIKLELENNPSKILDFFARVCSEAEIYSQIANSDIQNLPKEANRALEQLNQLRNKQYYPLVLSAFIGNASENEKVDLIKQIAAVAIRRSITGKNPNELETFFAENSSKLRRNEVTIPELILKLSQDYWITDEDIIVEIANLDFEDQVSLVKLILKEYEISKAPAQEKKLVDYTLEHILPCNPANTSDWNIPEDRQKELLWNIGNLTLVGQSYNSKMSNQNFEIKKTIYQSSEVRSTSALAKYQDWTEKNLLERNNDLGAFIVKCWPKI